MMTIGSNGNVNVDEWDEGEERRRRMPQRSLSLSSVRPILDQAADALLEAGSALESISSQVEKIAHDTARALSDSFEFKRHLKDITEREQVTRREVSQLKTLAEREQITRREVNQLKTLVAKFKRAAIAKEIEKRKVKTRKVKARKVKRKKE
jgi:hypothetical protein